MQPNNKFCRMNYQPQLDVLMETFDNTVSPSDDHTRNRPLYLKVARHWHRELINSDTSEEWFTDHGSVSQAIVRKLAYELKQKSENCHELLRTRLSNLNLSLNEDEAFCKLQEGVQPYGIYGKLEELYSINSVLIGKSEELIVAMRDIEDNQTASLLTRMRNLQLERHQLYSKFFQPGHIAYELDGNSSRGSYFKD